MLRFGRVYGETEVNTSNAVIAMCAVIVEYDYFEFVFLVHNNKTVNVQRPSFLIITSQREAAM